MEKPNIQAWSGRDLQNTKALLITARNVGFTTIESFLEYLERELTAQRQGSRLVVKKTIKDDSSGEIRKSYLDARNDQTRQSVLRSKMHHLMPDCPECGSRMAIEEKRIDEKIEYIFHCKYACQYSEYIGTHAELVKRLGV